VAQRRKLEQQLRAGIRAAQQGNKEQARQLLTQVLRVDRSNELAWIWLASAVNSRQERRRCLEEVLKINPGNQRARQALNQLVGVVRSGDQIDMAEVAQAAATGGGSQRRQAATSQKSSSGGLTTSQFIAFAISSVVLLGALAFSLGVFDNAPIIGTPSPTPIRLAAGDRTRRPTNTPFPPTETPPARIVTQGPDNLEPTFTPTNTATPTVTPTPTATLPPISVYNILYTAEQSNLNVLYQIRGDGELNSQLANNVIDIAIDPSGRQIAFVREVAYGAEANDTGDINPATTSTELFIAPIDAVDQAQQLTTLRGPRVSHPTFSPNGDQIIYVSDQDGDEELYILNLTNNATFQLTTNNGIDRDPAWSPDGELVVFASDRASPGFTDLFVFNVELAVQDPQRAFTNLTDNAGNSSDPAWSPDGQQIAFVNDRQGADIFLIDPSGRRTRNVTVTGNDELAPVWTPDGRYLVYLSNSEGLFQMHFITPTGRNNTMLPISGLDLRSVQVRPN